MRWWLLTKFIHIKSLSRTSLTMQYSMSANLHRTGEKHDEIGNTRCRCNTSWGPSKELRRDRKAFLEVKLKLKSKGWWQAIGAGVSQAEEDSTCESPYTSSAARMRMSGERREMWADRQSRGFHLGWLCSAGYIWWRLQTVLVGTTVSGRIPLGSGQRSRVLLSTVH